jgi:uncharacterized membrane protein (DUF485 family)
LSAPDWESIGRAPEFLQLYRRRQRLQNGLLVIALLYFFALPIGAGYFPQLFRIRVWGVVNVGLLFALSQFLVAAAVAISYARIAARRIDPLARDVASKYLPHEERHRGQ